MLSEKKFRKKVSKLLEQPEAKLVFISEAENLHLTGKLDLISGFYLAATPRGVFAYANGHPWQPSTQTVEFPLELGAITPKKFLIRNQGEEPWGFLWDQDNAPEEGQMFLLFVWFERFCELCVVTPSIKEPFRLAYPPDLGNQLFGLSLDILTAYKPDLSSEVREFFLLESGQTNG